jgi:hypothetical protein
MLSSCGEVIPKVISFLDEALIVFVSLFIFTWEDQFVASNSIFLKVVPFLKFFLP